MNQYLFVLGNTPELSLLELKSVLNNQKIELVFKNLVKISLESDEEAKELINVLGGTVKVVRMWDVGCSIQNSEFRIQDLEASNLELEIANFLATKGENITFAISKLGQELPSITDIHIKDHLKNQGVKSRFVRASTALLLNRSEIINLNLINIDDQVIFGTTLAVQDINDWTKRDRSKPYADRKKGMLPPKVARMMVNLGVRMLDVGCSDNKPYIPNPTSQILVYDPFCGSGTILMEAMVRGYSVIGSDLDKESVIGSRKNLTWLSQEYNLNNEFEVFQADVSQAKLEKKVDLIITEPFLGKQTPKEKDLPGIYRGLEKLYLGAFKNWVKLLDKDGLIIIILPKVVTSKKTYSLEKFVDNLEKWGYTASSEPVVYARKEAVVQREIYIIKKVGLQDNKMTR